MEEWKQACQASETALKEVLSKGDIDEALRRESEAKKTVEETQKMVEELQKNYSDLQAVLASTSTRAEQCQKQVEEYKSTLAMQQSQSSKQLDDMKSSRMVLEQQLNTTRQQLTITRQQLQESQQQFNLYKSTHPAVTLEELSSLQAASDRLKGVEVELMQLKQIQEKKENKKLKGKSKVTPLIQTSSPSLFQKRSSIDLSLPAEKRLSVSDADTVQSNPGEPLISPPVLNPVQPPVSTPRQPLGLNPLPPTTKTTSE